MPCWGRFRSGPWVGALAGLVAGLLIVLAISDRVSYVPYSHSAAWKGVNWGKVRELGANIGVVCGALAGVIVGIRAAIEEFESILARSLACLLAAGMGLFVGALAGALGGLIAALLIVALLAALLPVVIGVVCGGLGGFLLGPAANELFYSRPGGHPNEVPAGCTIGAIAGGVVSALAWSLEKRFLGNTVFIPIFALAGYLTGHGIGKLVDGVGLAEVVDLELDEDEEIRTDETPWGEDQAKREEIDRLVAETMVVIKTARARTSDPTITAALMLLEEDLLNVADEFKSGVISYSDARARVVQIKQDAEALGSTTGGGRTTKERVEKETYYAILGIKPDASQDEIKKAYRAKMSEHHPDHYRNKPKSKQEEAEAMSKKVNEAHEVLMDPNKRREYDRDIGA